MSADNTTVDVTANASTITVGPLVNTITVKDRTGSPTPTISVLPATPAGGTAPQIEDPNNLGTMLTAGTAAVLKQPGGAVTWQFNGTVYEVVRST